MIVNTTDFLINAIRKISKLKKALRSAGATPAGGSVLEKASETEEDSEPLH